MGGGACCRAMGITSAAVAGARTWAIDYRMPPDHPYPAALDDCLAAYRALLREYAAENIIVRGGSAGGNLAAALILRARDEDLPLPVAAVLMTPEVDLTESGDSFQANLGVDTVLTGSLMPANLLYAGGHDLAHPYLSPLFGDFTKGFPPTFLTTGTRDLFLSNTVRMHRALRAAGIAAAAPRPRGGSPWRLLRDGSRGCCTRPRDASLLRQPLGRLTDTGAKERLSRPRSMQGTGESCPPQVPGQSTDRRSPVR